MLLSIVGAKVEICSSCCNNMTTSSTATDMYSKLLPTRFGSAKLSSFGVQHNITQKTTTKRSVHIANNSTVCRTMSEALAKIHAPNTTPKPKMKPYLPLNHQAKKHVQMQIECLQNYAMNTNQKRRDVFKDSTQCAAVILPQNKYLWPRAVATE
jgi:hypothetical protein